MPTLTSVNAQWTNTITVGDADMRRNDSGSFLGDGTALGVRGGIVRHGDNSLLVTVNGSDQITVQAGVAVVPSATALAGAYLAAFGAVTGPGSGTAIATRNATNPRIDLVIIDVSAGLARIRTVDGIPGSSPSAPALPAGSAEIGRLNVPANGGGAVTVTSTFRTYTTALGGTLPVETASQLPGSGMQKGQRAVALDTGITHEWNGTAWISQTDLSGVGAGGIVLGTNVIAAGEGLTVYRRGGMAEVVFYVQCSAALAGDAVLFTTPAGFRPPRIVRGGATNTSGAWTPVYITTGGVVQVNLAQASGTLLYGHLVYPV